MWEVFSGKIPCDDVDFLVMLWMFTMLHNSECALGWRMLPTYSEALPEEMMALMQGCWDDDETLRPAADEFLTGLSGAVR